MTVIGYISNLTISVFIYDISLLLKVYIFVNIIDLLSRGFDILIPVDKFKA